MMHGWLLQLSRALKAGHVRCRPLRADADLMMRLPETAAMEFVFEQTFAHRINILVASWSMPDIFTVSRAVWQL
jgi:hypothetical protein